MTAWMLVLAWVAHGADVPAADGTLRWNDDGAKLSWVLPAGVFAEADADGNRLLTTTEVAAAESVMVAAVREGIRLSADGEEAAVSLAEVGVEGGLAKRHKFGTDRVRVLLGLSFAEPPTRDVVLTVDLLGDTRATLDVVREGSGSGLGTPTRVVLGGDVEAVALLGELPRGSTTDRWPWLAVLLSLVVAGWAVLYGVRRR